VLADEHRLPHLVDDFEQFDDDAVARASRMIALLLDRRFGPDGVADEYRLDEAQAIVAGGHGARIDVRRRHADADAEDERAMRHATLEVLRRAPLGVHVMGKEVAGLAGVGDDVGFGDRAPQRLARFVGGEILEKPLLNLHDARRTLHVIHICMIYLLMKCKFGMNGTIASGSVSLAALPRRAPSTAFQAVPLPCFAGERRRRFSPPLHLKSAGRGTARSVVEGVAPHSQPGRTDGPAE